MYIRALEHVCEIHVGVILGIFARLEMWSMDASLVSLKFEPAIFIILWLCYRLRPAFDQGINNSL